MKRSMIICLLVFGLCGLLPAYAQDSLVTPVPGTRADNECYTGGTMEGKCDRGFHADGSVTPDEIEWAWRCGWFLARFNDGVISREKVPSDCGLLLRGLPPPQCIITFSGMTTECLNGSTLSEDAGNDGSFENSFRIISSSSAGDSGSCPSGTVYVADVGDYQVYAPELLPWLESHGFKVTDDFCRVL